jgi:hypothetical protein
LIPDDGKIHFNRRKTPIFAGNFQWIDHLSVVRPPLRKGAKEIRTVRLTILFSLKSGTACCRRQPAVNPEPL